MDSKTELQKLTERGGVIDILERTVERLSAEVEYLTGENEEKTRRIQSLERSLAEIGRKK